jgi:hypothetical protein
VLRKRITYGPPAGARVEARLARHVGELAGGAARDPHVIHQVFAEHAARVAEATRRRVEQDARRLERLRAQHHGLGADLARLARDAIDVVTPRALLVALSIST